MLSSDTKLRLGQYMEDDLLIPESVHKTNLVPFNFLGSDYCKRKNIMFVEV